MPLPLITIILVAVATFTVEEADKENIAFTIKQKLQDGDYKVVQGIFNKRDTLVDGHTP